MDVDKTSLKEIPKVRFNDVYFSWPGKNNNVISKCSFSITKTGLWMIVGKNGSYNGGIIAPGVNLSLEALYLATANLPKVSLRPLVDKNSSIIGKNTISAMESGIFWGYVSMIEGLIEKIKSVNKFSDYQVVATGGLSNLFKNSVKSIDVIVDDLTLIGLVKLYLNNKN